MGFVLESVALEFLGLTLAAILSVYLYLKHVVYNFWTSKGVPQEEPSVPYGNMYATIVKTSSVGETFQQFYDKYKKHPVFGIYAMHTPNLVINDPDLIRHILVKDFKYFHDRGMYCNEKIDPLSGHLFVLPGSKWRNLRAKLSPTFTSGKIKYMFETVKESCNVLASVLEDKAEAKEVVEMKDIVARFSTDIIASVAFGIQCNSLTNPNAEFRYWGRKIAAPRTVVHALGMFVPFVLDLFSIPITHKDVEDFFLRTFNETVAYRKANNISRPDFLQLLIQLMDKGKVDDDEDTPKNEKTEGDNLKVSALEGAAQAFVFFLAGFETSSLTVTLTIYELAMNPEIQEKLQKEIDRELEKGGGLTYNSLHGMTYLNMVVNETMRKYPPLPILNRACTEEYTFPNSKLTIPKGTSVIIPVLGLQRDPEIYPDPEKFDPERFNEENTASRHHYTYLPFGEGPRLCIGMRFGLVQVKAALITLLSKYRFKPAPDTKYPFEVDKHSFTVAPVGGISLRIEKR